MLSKRAITLCNIILQLIIITKKMYAIIGGLRSGGLKSDGLLSCALMSGRLMSGGLKSAHHAGQRVLKLCERFGLEGPIVMRAFRHNRGVYVNQSSSSRHAIRQIKSNVIATKSRNSLLVKTISNPLFFGLVGPP